MTSGGGMPWPGRPACGSPFLADAGSSAWHIAAINNVATVIILFIRLISLVVLHNGRMMRHIFQ